MFQNWILRCVLICGAAVCLAGAAWAGVAMDSCPSTETIASLPFMDTDTTANRVNDYQLAKGTCSIYDTANGPDTAYRFTPSRDMSVGIRMNPTGWSSCVLYVVTDCQDVAGSCVKMGDSFPPFIDRLALTGGTSYYIICDGQFSNNSGAYTLLVEEVPANETCETAQAIHTLPFIITASTWMAHNDTKDTNNCMCSTAPGPEIVYSYTPLADERVSFKMTPIAPFKFPAFYIGANCSDITQSCLVGKYNTTGAPIVFDHIPLTAGVQYNIYCDSFIFSTGGWGNFTLEVTPSTSFAEGENCADSIVIPSLPFAQASTLSGRALDCPTTACGRIVSHDAVYTYTPPEDVWINATLAFGGFRATLAIVRDCANPNGTCVSGKTGGSSFTLNEIPLIGGDTYYLIVGGDRFCDWGDYTLSVEKGFGPPPNDTCATAVEIDAIPWTAEGWTYSGTNDYNPEDSCAVGGDGLDVVYSYTPQQSGWINIIYRPEAGVQPTLCVVTDCANLNTSCVAGCSETNGPCILLDVPVAAAVTYYIICDTRTATAGTRFTLSVSPSEPPVPNDLCSTAEVIASLPFAASGDTTLASPNYVACCESRCGYGHGPDVVYAFTPSDPSGVEYITVNMQAPSFRGALFIVSDCGNIDGSCVAGTYAKDIGEPLSLNQIFLQTGSTYYIICNGLGLDDAGPFTLNVQSVANPFPHDKCDGARVIDALPYITTDTTTGARDNYSVKGCFVDYKSTGPDVVYSYTPPLNQSLVVHLTPLSDALEGDSWIYAVSDCDNIANNCHNFSRDGFECFNAQAGVTYYFIIDGDESGDHGEFRLEISAPPPPPNDTCENAHVIPSLPFEVADWNCGATNNYEVPRNVSSCLGSSSLGIATGCDMVYAYTPPQNQYITIKLMGDCGLDDWLFWVVTDCSNPVGTCVAGDIANSFFGCVASVDFLSVAQGVTYYIIVDSRDSNGEGAGMFSLSVDESFQYDAALDVLGGGEAWGLPGNRVNYLFKLRNTGKQPDVYRFEIAGAIWQARVITLEGNEMTTTSLLNFGGQVAFLVQVEVPPSPAPETFDRATLKVTSTRDPNIPPMSREWTLTTNLAPCHAYPFEDHLDGGTLSNFAAWTTNTMIAVHGYNVDGANADYAKVLPVAAQPTDGGVALCLDLAGRPKPQVSYTWGKDKSGDACWLDVYDGVWHSGVAQLKTSGGWVEQRIDLSPYQAVDHFLLRWRHHATTGGAMYLGRVVVDMVIPTPTPIPTPIPEDWLYVACYEGTETPGVSGGEWRSNSSSNVWELRTDVQGSDNSIYFKLSGGVSAMVYRTCRYDAAVGATIEFRARIREVQDIPGLVLIGLEEGTTQRGASLRFTQQGAVVRGDQEVASTEVFDTADWHVYRFVLRANGAGAALYRDYQSQPLAVVNQLASNAVGGLATEGSGFIAFGGMDGAANKRVFWDLDWLCVSVSGPYPVTQEGWWYPGEPQPVPPSFPGIGIITY